MCSTPFGIRDSTPCPVVKTTAMEMCSTPFGIRDSTHPSCHALRMTAYVLNAFRHQRFDTNTAVATAPDHWMCSTPFGIRDSTPLRWDSRHGNTLCSTPFGIRDSTRMIAKPRNQAMIVLNAFRHQRFDTATAKTLIEFITEANLASTS